MQKGFILANVGIDDIIGEFSISDKVVELLSSGEFVIAPCFRKKGDGSIEIVEISVVPKSSAQQVVTTEQAICRCSTPAQWAGSVSNYCAKCDKHIVG